MSSSRPHFSVVTLPQDGYDAIDFTDNEISKLENFPLMRRLRSIYAANNRISRVEEGLGASLPYLETLVLTSNRITSLAEIDSLASLSTLITLSLLQNPVTRKPNYRWYVVWRFPVLRVLDFQRVTRKEREAATKFFASKGGKAYVKEVADSRRAQAPGGGPGGIGPSLSAGGIATAVSQSQPPQQPKFTPEELVAIHAAIAEASSVAEMNRLEGFLQKGICPPELLLARGGQAAAGVSASSSSSSIRSSSSSISDSAAAVVDGGMEVDAVAAGGGKLNGTLAHAAAAAVGAGDGVLADSSDGAMETYAAADG